MKFNETDKWAFKAGVFAGERIRWRKCAEDLAAAIYVHMERPTDWTRERVLSAIGEFDDMCKLKWQTLDGEYDSSESKD